MSLDTFTPAFNPSYNSDFDHNARVLSANFGDGYKQKAPWGLNNISMKGSLVWDALQDDDAQEIIDFFVTKQGSTAFYYTLPWEDDPRKWTCEKWKRVVTNYNTNTITAEFEESFVLD